MSTNVYHYTELVNFPDIDLGGVLYHGRYLDYYDRARQNVLRQNNLSFADLFKQNIGLVVGEMQVRFVKPVAFEDRIHIYSSIVSRRSKTVEFKQAMAKQEIAGITDMDVLANHKNCINVASFTVICIDLKRMRAMPFPEELSRL